MIAGFLYSRGVGPEKFDLKNAVPRVEIPEGKIQFSERKFNRAVNYDFGFNELHKYPYYPFEVFDDNLSHQKPQKGDIVLYGPFSSESIFPSEWFESKEYRPYKFNYGYLVPDLSLKTAIKKNIDLKGYSKAFVADQVTRGYPEYILFIKN